MALRDQPRILASPTLEILPPDAHVAGPGLVHAASDCEVAAGLSQA